MGDELFSLRYCFAPFSTERVWGVLDDDHVFYALWWDPNHAVAGAQLDDTAKGGCHINGCLHQDPATVTVETGAWR